MPKGQGPSRRTGGKAGHSRPWGTLRLAKDKTETIQIGELHLLVRFFDGEVHIAHYHIPSGDGGVKAMDPSELTWQRFVAPTSALEVAPALPDRPVVVQVESPFWLPTGARTEIFVRVPVWVQIRAGGSSGAVLVDLPSAILSNTWFGSFTEGELCYWISSGARREAIPDPTRPHTAICPVEVRNDAKENLFVDYFCLRVPLFSLFDDGEQLWSDVSSVSYRGPKLYSRVRATGRRPRAAKGAKLVAPPREQLRKWIVARTFAKSGDLPGLGVRFV